MDVEPYDHLRASEGSATSEDAHGDDLAPGVYRVVGVDDERATLLLVADADGRRVWSGRVERVPATALEAFDGTENPDADPGPVRCSRRWRTASSGSSGADSGGSYRSHR